MSDINRKQYGRAAIGVMISTIVVKLFGTCRDLTLSYFYGSSSLSDAYILATTIPVTIFSFVYEGVGASYIPACAMTKTKEEENKFTSQIINILLLITLGFVIVIELFPGYTIKIFAAGFKGEILELAKIILRSSIIGVFFSSSVYVLSYYLNYNHSFAIPTLRSLPMDLIVIISIAVSAKYDNIYVLSLAIPFSLFSELIFILPFTIKKGYKYSFKFSFDNELVKKVIMWSLPVIASSAVADINAIIDQQFASLVTIGGISSLTYSGRTLSVLRMIFFTPLITVLFPDLSRGMIDKDGKKKIGIIGTKAFSVLILLSVPLSMGVCVYSNQIIELLFQRGSFDKAATLITGGCLDRYALGLLGYAISAFATKVFYSMEKMKIPMYISIIGVFVNIIGNLYLSKIMGISGLALASSISILVIGTIEYIMLSREICFDHKHVVLIFVKSLLSSGVMITLVYFLYKNYLIKISNKLGLLGVFILGCVIYAIMLLIFKVSEIKNIVHCFRTEIIDINKRNKNGGK